MSRRVRVRFAPSPTGPLHLGGVRTALFNFLFARAHGGDFILRIEDTDTTRYVEGAEEYIFNALRWCGLTVDEGVQEGGPHGPYRQSERRDLYFDYAKRLVEGGWAYYAFDSPEALAEQRAAHEARGEVFAYGPGTRDGLRNSLSMDEATLQRELARNDWVIRFRTPPGQRIAMDDMIRGHVEVQSDTLDDKVLYKRSDGLPTYHLANVVDDYLMEITHVIRGEEWLPSLPLHYLLYQALGWESARPQFAHLPLILKPTGRGKLSKRDGDRLGFAVFPLAWDAGGGEIFRGYREDGYLPSGFLNMLALLGWHPEDAQEVFTLKELIGAFSLARVSRSGARFDPEKARWFNHAHILRTPADELAPHLNRALEDHGLTIPPERIAQAIELVRDRVDLLPDLWNETDYLWLAPRDYDPKALRKHCTEATGPQLETLIEILRPAQHQDGTTLASAVKAKISEAGWPMGRVMNTLRLALVGAPRGIDLGDIMHFLGPDETIARIQTLLNYLRAHPTEKAN